MGAERPGLARQTISSVKIRILPGSPHPVFLLHARIRFCYMISPSHELAPGPARPMMMRVRAAMPRPGMKGRLRYYGLDFGRTYWPEGLPVEVVALRDRLVRVREEGQAREIILPMTNVDVGCEFELDGIWQSEGAPAVLDQLEKELVIYRSREWIPAVESHRKSCMTFVEDLLRKYKRLPAKETYTQPE